MGVYCATLAACVSAVQLLSLSRSLAPSRAEWYGVYQSENVWISSSLHTFSSPLSSGLTHKPLFCFTILNTKAHTHPLIHSLCLILCLSPPTVAQLAAGSLDRKQNSYNCSFLTTSAMFSFRPSHLNEAFQTENCSILWLCPYAGHTKHEILKKKKKTAEIH